MILSNKTYDILKWCATIVFPAIGTLYFALSGIWGLPYAQEVIGTITAIDTFLGVLIGVTTYNYNRSESYGDATLHIDKTAEDTDKYLFDIRTDLEELETRRTMAVKIDVKE